MPRLLHLTLPRHTAHPPDAYAVHMEHGTPAVVQHLDPHDASLLATTLSLSPEQRLQRLIDYVRFVNAGRAAMRAAAPQS